jgi:Protein of unknown function (DUF3455)
MRRRPLLFGLVALLGSTLVAGAAVPAGAGSGSKPPEIPKPIRVPAGQEVVLDVVGKGVQIYECSSTTLAWTLREPAAVLYGRRDRPVGIHFIGPTFESFDGSKVAGAVEASAPSPHGSILWLLLRREGNTVGDGVLSQVDFIQRLETRGGVAPTGACDPAADATVAVPYRARYVFYAG